MLAGVLYLQLSVVLMATGVDTYYWRSSPAWYMPRSANKTRNKVSVICRRSRTGQESSSSLPSTTSCSSGRRIAIARRPPCKYTMRARASRFTTILVRCRFLFPWYDSCAGRHWLEVTMPPIGIVTIPMARDRQVSLPACTAKP